MRPVDRIFKITKCTSQRELAELLGISQPSVSSVCKSDSGEVPAQWAITLMRIKGLHPEWLLSGEGPTHLPRGIEESLPSREEQFTEALRFVMQDLPALLKHIHSSDLSRELSRRLARAEKALLENAKGKHTAVGKAFLSELSKRSSVKRRARSDLRHFKKKE